MDLFDYNRHAWDLNVDRGEEFTNPATPEMVANARRGDLRLYLTPGRPMPGDWLPALHGLEVLCLAAGGGQYAPLLAAAGAHATVLDLSPKQLANDRLVADREGLSLRLVEGNMAEPAMFAEESFDLIIQPVSNLFVPDVRPVWKECYRLLKPKGSLLSGFMNPVFYIFDRNLMDSDSVLAVRHTLPYADTASLPGEELEQVIQSGWPLEFSHTLEDQIGGQIDAGFVISGFYEDRDPRSILDDYLAVYLSTRADKWW